MLAYGQIDNAIRKKQFVKLPGYWIHDACPHRICAHAISKRVIVRHAETMSHFMSHHSCRESWHWTDVLCNSKQVFYILILFSVMKTRSLTNKLDDLFEVLRGCSLSVLGVVESRHDAESILSYFSVAECPRLTPPKVAWICRLITEAACCMPGRECNCRLLRSIARWLLLRWSLPVSLQDVPRQMLASFPGRIRCRSLSFQWRTRSDMRSYRRGQLTCRWLPEDV
jgi:hypothetical protein